MFLNLKQFNRHTVLMEEVCGAERLSRHAIYSHEHFATHNMFHRLCIGVLITIESHHMHLL